MKKNVFKNFAVTHVRPKRGFGQPSAQNFKPAPPLPVPGLVPRRPSRVMRMAERPQVRPREPQVWPLAHAHHMVHIRRRLAAAMLAADRILTKEQLPALPPRRVIDRILLRCPRPVILAPLDLRWLPSRRPMRRRPHRHGSTNRKRPHPVRVRAQLNLMLF